MTPDEALQQVLAPYTFLVKVLESYPQHADFASGLHYIRTGVLLIKEGIQCSNFHDVKPVIEQDDKALAMKEPEPAEAVEAVPVVQEDLPVADVDAAPVEAEPAVVAPEA